MSLSSESRLPAGDELSSLMDGELEESAVARACSRWRDDPQARADWHAYQLIGDVLRSEDLASSASHDAAFLNSLRTRLAHEPVVLAPTPQAAVVANTRKRHRAWAGPAAVAAGFVAVAGVLVVAQMTGSLSLRNASEGAGLSAKAPVILPAMVVSEGAASGAAGDPQAVTLNGQLIRDVRLDEYLAAHKKFGGSSALGGPSGFLRNAAADGTSR